MDFTGFEQRKADHLRLALNPQNEASGGGGFDRIRLRHQALPELDLEQVTLDTDFLGYAAASPCFISSMTAGHKDGESLNTLLARTAASMRWPMGVGSQRRELSDTGAGEEWRRLREQAPDACFFSNIGITQLIRSDLSAIQRIIDNLQAQALIVHCNALQEAIQPEGTPQFAGGLRALSDVAGKVSVPVIVKETGCGFSPQDLQRIAETGVAAVDVSGYGGTHWGRIEGGRAAADSVHAQAAQTFADWGVPTVECLLTAAEGRNKWGAKIAIWSSGGVRTGLDAAKSIALGATAVGFAKPALTAAVAGEAELQQWMRQMEFELKVALFCTGSATPADLREGDKWLKI